MFRDFIRKLPLQHWNEPKRKKSFAGRALNINKNRTSIKRFTATFWIRNSLIRPLLPPAPPSPQAPALDFCPFAPCSFTASSHLHPVCSLLNFYARKRYQAIMLFGFCPSAYVRKSHPRWRSGSFTSLPWLPIHPPGMTINQFSTWVNIFKILKYKSLTNEYSWSSLCLLKHRFSWWLHINVFITWVILILYSKNLE